VDAPVETAPFEGDGVGLLEQVGIEDHRPVGAIEILCRLTASKMPDVLFRHARFMLGKQWANALSIK
jgi:hypothetical protein